MTEIIGHRGLCPDSAGTPAGASVFCCASSAAGSRRFPDLQARTHVALTAEQMKTLYSNMVRARRMDETMVQGLADGKAVSFFHSVQGEEAVGVGGCTFLRP